MGDDFFARVEDKTFMKDVDFIFDNPPYTSPETKQKVLEALKKTGKPFCMLLPLAVVHGQFVRDLFKEYMGDFSSDKSEATSNVSASGTSRIQLVIPRKVIVTKGDVLKGGEEKQKEIPFKYLV